jgi:preprotein translocase subunit YajC
MLYAICLLAQNNTDNQEGPPFIVQFLPLIAIFVLFYFLLILPAQRRERRHKETVLNALKKNDKVLTTAGIIGVVANIKDEEVTLRLEEGKIRVLRSTITRIFGTEEPAKDQKPEVEERIKK